MNEVGHSVPAFASSPIPARAGIGFRLSHSADFDSAQPVNWLEIHSENYLTHGGPRLRMLEKLRRDYPLSCHGVGLSLGSADGLDPAHLDRLAKLYKDFEPGLISDHLAWAVQGGHYYNDLLPLPLTEETLEIVYRNIDHAQSCFGRSMLIENPSSYLSFAESTIPEGEFLSALIERTGCGLLLDVNNIYVSATNLQADAKVWLDSMPLAAVGEIHVAGHRVDQFAGLDILIDDHGSAVPAAVWQLLDHALSRIGPRPVLVEWDMAVPPLAVLLAEAEKADARIAAIKAQAA